MKLWIINWSNIKVQYKFMMTNYSFQRNIWFPWVPTLFPQLFTISELFVDFWNRKMYFRSICIMYFYCKETSNFLLWYALLFYMQIFIQAILKRNLGVEIFLYGWKNTELTCLWWGTIPNYEGKQKENWFSLKSFLQPACMQKNSSSFLKKNWQIKLVWGRI